MKKEFEIWLRTAYPTAELVDYESIKQVFYAGALIGFNKGLLADKNALKELHDNLEELTNRVRSKLETSETTH